MKGFLSCGVHTPCQKISSFRSVRDRSISKSARILLQLLSQGPEVRQRLLIYMDRARPILNLDP